MLFIKKIVKRWFFIKAQVAMEYLMVVSFVILMTIPLIAVFVNQSTNFNDEVSLSQSNKAAQRIIDTANTVYYLGPPSKRTISVYFPEGIRNLTIQNNSIEVNIRNEYVFSITGEPQLNGTLDAYEGLRTITIEAKNDFVQIK